ncbi:DUF1622 domain-containing protein [Micromonospora craniellae]|uniref:DUF1622 domain-containing protein n=1 Tax=Micromonospora craniellae TaxID=2294034 RepID=A0A372FU04_9ACTN|nr:DUF1622 domain-containing protein [Micromonospora craniellae]QOC92472.1 DUF1622 domain-containing protein [Micromonospora craniellae]RFS44282.1 DUF1622 domain-containing protein [Micromonospora craniellae]
MNVDVLLERGHHTLVIAVELVGAAVIVVGAAWAALRFVVDGIRYRDAAVFTRIRLTLGRFLVLGLEFQLAADILRTALSPTFAQIGQLAAIAAIRTVLNHVLGREIEREQGQVDRPGRAS